MPEQPAPSEHSDPETPSAAPGFFSRFFSNIKARLLHEPKDREELLLMLRRAQARQIFEDDALSMMEGALQVSELSAADLMVPRAQIEVVDLSQPRQTWLAKIVAHGHSRFPVVDGELDEVKGILHAKDLLRLLLNPRDDVMSHLRAPRFIPETQPLNILLKDFRLTRNHLALVIDEFGSVSGLITIEDVIEQVVGNIDDEFDNVNTGKDNIVRIDRHQWRVKADTQLSDFNTFFDTELTDDYCETIGGMVTDRFERVPRKGETIEFDGFRFRVGKADERQTHVLFVERLNPESLTEKELTQGESTDNE